MTKKLISVALALFLLLGCLSGVTLAAAQVPTIANASAATTEAAVILNPSEKPYTLPTSYTREDLQKILVETALAYYYHDPYIQYDGIEVWESGPARAGDLGTPEDASFDSTVFSVCSNFCEKNYYNAFDVKPFNGLTRTRSWCCMPTGTAGIVYQYIGSTTPATVTEGERDNAKALVEARKVLQPGDIIVGADSESGHAMFFVGDLYGDGKEYLIDCGGSSHTPQSGSDPREVNGAIRIQNVDECCFTPGGYWNLGAPRHSALGFAIMRPLDDPTYPKTPTPWGACRLLFPGITITRELDRMKYDGALTGEEIPVTVTIVNNGKEEYKELPVEEYVPEKAELVADSATVGAKVDGKTIRWSVKIPAGKSISLTYKVRLTAALGETVTFPRGKVAEIPTRETTLQIVGKKLTDAQKTALVETAKKATKNEYKDLDFFNTLYGKALGVDAGLPATATELVKKLTTAKMSGVTKYCYRKDSVAAEDAALDRMIIPLNFAGRHVVGDGSHWSRVREYKEEYYQPGDLFIGLWGRNTATLSAPQDVDMAMYLGNGEVLSYPYSGEPQIATFAATVGHSLRYNVAFALRPTQGYDDLNARVYASNVTLPFTDVKEADWFYTYVKDLYEDGTVNGMTATTFVPAGNLTYGQALKLLDCALGAGLQGPLAGGHWASGYMRYAARNGWIGGTVDLDGKITRLEFCKIAAKAKNLTEQPASNPFTDTSDASVLALNKAGVINGMTATTFEPNGLLTRAQISKIIWILRDV